MVKDSQQLGMAVRCIAIGEHMRRPAELLQRLDRNGLQTAPVGDGIECCRPIRLTAFRNSRAPVPAKICRRRAQRRACDGIGISDDEKATRASARASHNEGWSFCPRLCATSIGLA